MTTLALTSDVGIGKAMGRAIAELGRKPRTWAQLMGDKDRMTEERQADGRDRESERLPAQGNGKLKTVIVPD